MLENELTTGSLRTSDSEKRRLAAQSHAYNMSVLCHRVSRAAIQLTCLCSSPALRPDSSKSFQSTRPPSSSVCPTWERKSGGLKLRHGTSKSSSRRSSVLLLPARRQLNRVLAQVSAPVDFTCTPTCTESDTPVPCLGAAQSSNNGRHDPPPPPPQHGPFSSVWVMAGAFVLISALFSRLFGSSS